jgi:hypothetical protein
MAAHKFYAWERATFEWACNIEVTPGNREIMVQALAARYGLGRIRVEFTTRGGGWAHGDYKITLPRDQFPCSLAVIVHEVAHIYDHRRGGKGHGKSFRTALIKIMAETKYDMPKLISDVVTVRSERDEAMAKAAAREQAAAQRRADAKAKRGTREFKMERLRARIKRLDSRMKRLATIRKSAERSLRAYERAAALAAQHLEDGVKAVAKEIVEQAAKERVPS